MGLVRVVGWRGKTGGGSGGGGVSNREHYWRVGGRWAVADSGWQFTPPSVRRGTTVSSQKNLHAGLVPGLYRKGHPFSFRYFSGQIHLRALLATR